MDIIYLGHSSFRIKGKTTTLVCDPFDPKMVGLKYPSVEADIVTVSHNHNDHNQVQLVKGAKRVIEGPGEYEVSGISILGFASFHDAKEGTLRGKNTIFVFEVDGIRIAHLGDLGYVLSDKEVEELGDIDILLIPVGGFYTIGSAEAVKVVQAVEPKIIIPMHYSAGGVIGELAPVDNFLKEMGLPVTNLPKLSVKKEELTEEQKIVVLEIKGS
jgi:L-ascorbate metabolism protein UlaG (beta-lactamase superfamily)